jgi:hypothetical protein
VREPDPIAHEVLLQRRVERAAGDRKVVRRPTPPRRAVGAGAFAAAIALGFQHVFEPPEDEAIVVEVDATEPRGERWVTYEHDPFSPGRSRASVRPWLAPIP